MLLRILSSVLVPEVLTDWDERADHGRNYYSAQWRRVRREYAVLTVIYSLENIILSLPLLYTSARILIRHSVLAPLDIEAPVISSAYFLLAFIPGREEDTTRKNSILLLFQCFSH